MSSGRAAASTPASELLPGAVSEETMKRRLSRAKGKIKATGIPFAVPDAHLLPELALDALLQDLGP
jgi:predicted RNA polymerase sigma factor